MLLNVLLARLLGGGGTPFLSINVIITAGKQNNVAPAAKGSLALCQKRMKSDRSQTPRHNRRWRPGSAASSD